MDRSNTCSIFNAVIAMAFLCAGSERALGDPGLEDCEDRYSFFQDNLFRVEADGVGIGIAMFVGRRGGELWLATPAHVAFAEVDHKLTNDPKLGLLVRDRDGKTLPPCANPGPTNRTKDYDLTFLCIDPGFNTFVHDEVAADLLDMDATFVLFGSATSLQAESRGIRVEKLDTTAPLSGAAHRIAETATAPGDSGAIAGNCRGIVGMFLNSDQHLLSLETIRAQAGEAQVPWTLSKTEYFARSATSLVCLTFETSASHALMLRPVSGGKELVLEGCMPVPHASYEVLTREPWLNCTPRNLVLSSRSEARVDLKASCSVRLAGHWQSTDAGELACIETSPGLAECSGWLGLKVGMFSGTASAKGDSQVVFRGSFAGLFNSDMASGEFSWSNDALQGTLRFGGWERKLSLRRSP